MHLGSYGKDFISGWVFELEQGMTSLMLYKGTLSNEASLPSS